MFHFRPKPSPPKPPGPMWWVARVTPSQAVDSSAIVTTPGTRRYTRGVHLLEEGDRVQVLPAAVLVRRPLARARASSRGRASRRRRRPAGRRCGTPRTSTRRWRPGSCAPPCGRSRTPASPSRGARPASGSSCSYSVRPSNSASAHSSRGKCAGTQSMITPMPGPVQRVDQVLEVVGGAEPGGRRVEAGDLVAPGAAEGMLGDRHQLDVREAQVRHVRGQLLGQLTVRQPWPPGRQMDLVHRERRLVDRQVGARRAIHSSSCHSWCESCTIEELAGGTSVRPRHRVGAQRLASRRAG